MIESNIRIKGAGRINRIVSRDSRINIVSKVYHQRDTGSAYKKIACDIICMMDAFPDATKISLRWEETRGLSDGNLALIRRQVSTMKRLYPDVEFVTSFAVERTFGEL